MSMEKWINVNLVGCQDKYSVSSFGRVYNNFDKCFVSPVLTGKPQYWYVNLTPTEGKRILRRVHNLMLLSFHPKDDGKTVDHKDRNKYNNSLWNLRWADRKLQSRNRDYTCITDEGIFLADLLDGGDYHWFLYWYNQGITSYEKLKYLHEKYKEYGAGWNREHPSGRYLFEWCEENNLCFYETRNKINIGWDYYEILQGYRLSDHDKGVECDSVWFPDTNSFLSYYGVGWDSYRRLKAEGKTSEEISKFDPLDKHRFYIDNFFGTKVEHCERVGVNINAVNARCNKRGISFEESLKMKPERINKYYFNGQVLRTKEIYEYFGINPRYANSYKSKVKTRTIKDVLEHFEVDTKNLEIEPCYA